MCRADVPCRECDRDGDAKCGLESEHKGDHVPIAGVEMARLEARVVKLTADLDAKHAKLVEVADKLRAERRRARIFERALRSIAVNTCGVEPLAAAFARGTLIEERESR